MSSTELEEKQRQLDDLQKSFNEYVESSKELEAELEAALEEAAEKIDRSAEREAAAEKRARELQSKVEELTKALSSKAHGRDNGKPIGGDEELLMRCRQLENENDDLRNQVRILEASVEDLNHKIAGLEEDAVFLKTDIEAITLSRDELEVEMKDEIETLEKKLEASDNERRKLSSDIAAMTKKILAQEGVPHDPNDEKVQMLLFKQDKDIDFIKATLDALAMENNEAHRHGHHDHHSPMWHEKVEELRTTLRITEQEKHELSEEVYTLRKHVEQASEAMVPREHFEELQEAFRESERERAQLLEDVRTLDTMLAAAKENEHPPEVVAQLQSKLADTEAAAKELGEQVNNLQKHLEAVIIEAQAAEELRFQNARQQKEIELLTVKLRDLELAKEEVEQALKDAKPKLESLGNYYGGWNISSLSQTSVEISSMSTTQVSITQIISSGDKDKMRAELLRLAQQYDALRNSNTRMLNKLQALQGNIQVCCRTRPPSYQELAQGGKVCIDAADDTELMCYDGRSEAWKSFFFDRVWRADANQAEVFADIEPMVISVLDGYNACILAYGQTGSGKTFTMDGYGDQYGANYRTIQKLFDLLILRKVQAEAHAARVEQLAREHSNGKDSKIAGGLKRKTSMSNNGPPSPRVKSSTSDETDDTNSAGSAEDEVPFSFSLTVSMMEIYNEQVYDLLTTSGGQSGGGVSLEIRQGSDNTVNVPGLVQMPVHSLQDVMSVFSRGTANRATASTNLNEHSSRSHLIVQVDVTTQRGSDMPVRGRLNLVDLAGSERVGKSGATGTVMKEAQHINKSLSALGDVMEALDQKSKHIPYRNSKLTYLLQNSLGGNSRTMMIVTVCPTDLTFEESLFTLQFATRVRNITVGPAQKQSNAKNLEANMKTLRAELKEVKRSKTVLEEQLIELKKEQKKVPATSMMEAKLKTIEEARKAGEILVQQLNRQLTDCNVKLADEKEVKDQLTAELNLAQRNLKKALEQIKELTKANERLENLLKRREAELDAAQAEPRAQQQEVEEPARPAPMETPAASSRPPMPTSVPSRGIGSSARRVIPTSSNNSTSSALSGPVRKTRPTALKEFMLPTASHVAHLAASAADHEAHSEAVTQATHGHLNPTLVVPPPPKRGPSPMHARRPSFSTINTVDINSVGGESETDSQRMRRSGSWQDVLAPTASRQAYITAAEAEAAAKAQEAKNATHPGFTRMSISPAPRRESDGDSVNTSRVSAADTVQYANPKGHSSWQDAMAPTAARMAAVTATQEEYNARAQERATATHPAGNRFSVSPASSRGRNDDESVNSSRLSADYVNPKGHHSWEDALAPTVARKAALTAQEEEYARRQKENAQATHPVGLGRFSVSPARSRWDTEEEPVKPPVNPDYIKPKGHSSWQDATAPTVSRQAAIAAAEAEALSPKDSTHGPSNASRPWVPASKDPGRPPQQPVSMEAYSSSERPARLPVSTSASTARDSSASRRASSAAATNTSTASSTASVNSASKRSSTAAASTTAASSSASRSAQSDSQNTSTSASSSLLASSSMVRRTSVSAEATNTVRMSSLSLRSEEAMKRHQMRMDKRREMTAGKSSASTSAQPDFNTSSR